MQAMLDWFDDSGNAALAALAVSLASVVVSLVALRKSSKAQQQMLEIEQSREHAKLMQSLQALIRAVLRKTDRGSWRLFVTNTGQGTARNVAITLDGKPMMEHPATSGNKDEIRIIGPDSEVSCAMGLTRGCTPPFELEATWDDDSGQQGRYDTTLTF